MLFWRIHQEVLAAALLACAYSCPVYPKEPPTPFTPSPVADPGKCDGLIGLFHHALLSGLISLPEIQCFLQPTEGKVWDHKRLLITPPSLSVCVKTVLLYHQERWFRQKGIVSLYLRCCLKLQSYYNNVLGWVATKKLLSHGLKIFLLHSVKEYFTRIYDMFFCEAVILKECPTLQSSASSFVSCFSILYTILSTVEARAVFCSNN